MHILKKISSVLAAECKNRGVYYTFMMYMGHVIGVLRAMCCKLLYINNIKCTIFSLQRGSTVEVFNRRCRVHIGSFVFIRKNVSIRIDFDGLLHIHDKVFINDNCTVNCVNHISIGAYTKIAPNVCINDHDHNYKGAEVGHLVKGEVHIGKHVWIGANTVILKDTHIGDNAVIAAGSVVKGHVPANTLYLNKRESKYVEYAQSSGS